MQPMCRFGVWSPTLAFCSEFVQGSFWRTSKPTSTRTPNKKDTIIYLKARQRSLTDESKALTSAQGHLGKIVGQTLNLIADFPVTQGLLPFAVWENNIKRKPNSNERSGINAPEASWMSERGYLRQKQQQTFRPAQNLCFFCSLSGAYLCLQNKIVITRQSFKGTHSVTNQDLRMGVGWKLWLIINAFKENCFSSLWRERHSGEFLIQRWDLAVFPKSIYKSFDFPFKTDLCCYCRTPDKDIISTFLLSLINSWTFN